MLTIVYRYIYMYNSINFKLKINKNHLQLKFRYPTSVIEICRKERGGGVKTVKHQHYHYYYSKKLLGDIVMWPMEFCHHEYVVT